MRRGWRKKEREGKKNEKRGKGRKGGLQRG